MNHPVPDYIRSLAPYVPGKPIQEVQREANLSRVIKLASNENPLGTSPLVLRAIQEEFTDIFRYPDASAYHLKQALSKHLTVPPTSLTLGNGSNEVIDNLIRTYCVPGDFIVNPAFSFIAYRISAQVHGVKTLDVPVELQCGFDSDQVKGGWPSGWKVEELLDLVRKQERVKLVFLGNPNNPTGTYIDSEEMAELVQGLSKIRGGSVVLVLDYAYWEYVTAKDLSPPLELLAQYPSAIVLRTFSKAYGLAGLRVGYGVASPEMVSYLEKVRQPFNVNVLALKAAEIALSDQDFVLQSRKINVQGMKFWEDQLRRKQVPFVPSQGNFILVNVKKGLGISGVEAFQACMKKGVIFRPVANYGLEDYLRITIGTPEENDFGIKVLMQCG